MDGRDEQIAGPLAGLVVDPGLRLALGMSGEELADLGLRDLVRRCLGHGIVPAVALRRPAARTVADGMDLHEPLSVAA